MFDEKIPLVDKSFTQSWWEGVCKDEEKLKRFLIKLYRTEYEGYTDNLDIMDKWCDPTYGKDKLAKRILSNTADDEKRHSDLLHDIIAKRGWAMPKFFDITPSAYWQYMDEAIVDLKSACAVCYFGERLAAERFAIMLEMECTPSDIRAFLEEALPDESYHATSFKHLAGDAVEPLYEHHRQALDIILSKK